MNTFLKVKTLSYLLSFLAFILFASFALADTFNRSQERMGTIEANSASSNYQLKAEIAHSGIGRSYSSNYVYEHGTWWASATVLPPPPPPPPSPTPPSSPPISVGGGGEISGRGPSAPPVILALYEGVGGVSPAVEETFAKVIPSAVNVVIDKPNLPQTLKKKIAASDPAPQIVRVVVSGSKSAQTVVIIVSRKIFPWLFWLALVLILIGIVLLALHSKSESQKKFFLWLGISLILVGIILFFASRYFYNLKNTSLDPESPTSTVTASQNEFADTVKNTMQLAPKGVYWIIPSEQIGGEKGARAIIVVKENLIF